MGHFVFIYKDVKMSTDNKKNSHCKFIKKNNYFVSEIKVIDFMISKKFRFMWKLKQDLLIS